MGSLLDTARVVVNQWASWCGPCRFEIPFFQHLAQRYDGRVAFLGVDAQDPHSDAATFLTHLGAYATEGKLNGDFAKYVLHG